MLSINPALSASLSDLTGTRSNKVTQVNQTQSYTTQRCHVVHWRQTLLRDGVLVLFKVVSQ